MASPPTTNWFKLNLDGSSMGNPGLAGGGGLLIRNERGEWIKGYARAIGITTSVAAELWALRDGIHLCSALKLPAVKFELDSKLVVDLMKKELDNPNGLDVLVTDCRESMKAIPYVRIQHCYREANKCADALAGRGAPFSPKTPLVFCQYEGSVCCSSTDDIQLLSQFRAMNVSDLGCRSLLKSILCSRCDQFSAELYQIDSTPRKVPALCNSTVSANSTLSQLAEVDFCSKVWDECKNVSILNYPYALKDRGGMPFNSTSKLTDIWQSKIAFCNEFGGASEAGEVCFDGGPVKIGNGSYLNMVAHPDGSNRVFLSDQPGKTWLETVPEQGSGALLAIDKSNPFLDLTDKLYSDAEFGMLGIAFYPTFQQNGCFFVSFNCDKAKWPGCSGRCLCISDVSCDPSKLYPEYGAQPCQYSSIIGEFTANGTTSQPSLIKFCMVTSVKPQEVKRIFTMGLPFTSHHGGQILFGPENGYLYFMMGDGGSLGDPYNFAQNKKSLLGKIIRLDIDNISRNFHYNPFAEAKELQPEIWALGFRNPWRCSFDSERPSYFLCADVGQDQYEEMDLVTKGGNYGWHVYEGPFIYNPSTSLWGNTSASSIDPIFPVMGYNHSEVNKGAGPASITGGYLYRSVTDPCMNGRYLYADLFANGTWILFRCAQDSPIQCSVAAGSSLPSLGYIFSFGEDNRKEIFILSSSGVYKIVCPSRCSRCNYTCSKENVTDLTRPASVPSPFNSTRSRLSNPLVELLLLVFSLLVFFGMFNL
ncbi:hypothetical protein ACJW31_01G279800 [Castanea mollissima]